MARKANLRRKIDRNLKRRASMEERKAYRKKIADSLQLAQERKEEQRRKQQGTTEGVMKRLDQI